MKFPFYEAAPKEWVTKCNLCGGEKFVVVSRVDRYGLMAPAARCLDCGLMFLERRMTPEAYREFYEAGHYRTLLGEFYGRPITATSIEAEQAHYADRLSDWLRPSMNGARGGLLLDLGGSTGVVAERLALDFNLDATVVEPSTAEADRARDRGLAVYNGGLEDYVAGGNHYDLITLCQTVDHLLDIGGALRRVRALLAQGGRFFVDYVENCPVKIDHPYYPSEPTMRRYLEESELGVKRLEPSGDGLHVNVLCEGA